MKRKLTTMLAVLLLAVGWPSDASAQLIEAKKADATHPSFTKQMKQKGDRHMSLRDLIEAPVKAIANQPDYLLFEDPAPAEDAAAPGSMLRAPQRANHTASVTHDRAWYEGYSYTWTDANGPHTSKITEPATNGEQMASLVKYIYQTPEIPGILYSDAKGADHEYPNIEFGYDIAPRGNSTTYGDIYIDFPTRYVEFDDIQIYVGDTRVSRWYASGWGTQIPSAWTLYNAQMGSNDYGTTYILYRDGYINGGYFRVNKSVLSNYSGEIKVYIHARKSSNSGTNARYLQVNHQYQEVTSTTLDWYEWTVLPNSTGSITKPTENGYTALLVKVKDGTSINKPMEEFTHSWSDITNYFDNYIEAIELLTDGVRIGGTTSNAGTVFSYTGNLNRFFFISKGKMAYLSSLENSGSTDRAPFYSMYEEFSPTTQASGDQITDFFERMDQGEAYDVVHDCQSVNYMEHYFSMTGKDGTTHNTLSNLIFYIPDDRGQNVSGSEWRNYDHKPRVGLYTAELEATATPNKTHEHIYDVNIHWETSLQTILGFDEPETHDLWVVVKDEQNNIVLDSLLTTTPDTTYTYQVPQYPESYTIDYIVRAWPTAADEPVDHTAESTGTFFADSDPDDVLIPGYKDFISIHRHHYESDFDIDEEYNYYRNFMTLANQNGTAGLTTARIDRGENVLHLFRYDYDKPTNETEAATLTFEHDGNLVNWSIQYLNQDIYTGHTPSNKYQLSTMQIPTSGSFTVGSGSSMGVLTSWSYASAGNFTVPTGWTATSTYDGPVTSFTSNDDNSMYLHRGGTITIPASMLNGNSTVDVVINAARYDNQNEATVAVNGDTKTLSSTTFSDFSWANVSASNGITITLSSGYASVMSIQVSGYTSGSGNTATYDTTYVQVDSISFYYDYGSISAGSTFTVNDGNWSSSTDAMYMNSSRFAYIRNYTTNAWENYLTYTVPADYGTNETLGFDVYVGSVSYSNYLGCDINGGNFASIVNTTGSNQYYTLWVTGLKAGDKVNFYGATPSSESGYFNNYQSPNIADIMVYRQQVTEVSGEDLPIDVSGIELVDQFRASTADDTHPYRYGYRLEYTGRGTAEWDTTKVSNVLIVPVKHSGSTLNGFYTFDEMIHDSIPELLQTNVKNGDLSMTLGGDNEIFYYTINRRPDDGNAWDRMSYMQFDNNHTFYTEGVNYLPQYFGSTNYPGDMIERLDNANVLTDDYNSYMKYGPVVWTYGYDRFYYDTKDLPSGLTADGYHNSYGAPVWKTGVGDVNLNGLQVQRQTKANGDDNPSTSWKDENGADCSLYFLGITADGILPTTNMKGEGGSNYYEPYMFRVWVKSNSGALRGFTPVSDSQGDHIVNNATLDHSMQVVYEEYTNSNVLYKPIPEQYTNARNIIKFGALKDVAASDLEVIVRFYYKVKHLDPVDDSQDNIVTLDFTANEWQIPVGNTSNWQTGSADYTIGEGDDALTINLANKYYYNEAVGFLMLGQNGTLTLPAFDRKVKQIQVVGRPGASSTVKMNVFVGNDAASTEVTGSTGTSIFDIAEQYQQVGTQYTIKVDNNYNAQIAQVIVIFEDEQPSGMMMRAPMRAGESHTSTLNFTAACGGSGTADDGTVWTVTSDGAESTFDNTKGIHYGTNKANVQYVNLSTSGIEGTIKQIVVNASTASGVTAYCDVTVGGNAFGEQKTLSTDATDYTFTGSATGDIVVSIHKPASATKALYCKSIVVTYETEGGQIVTAELVAPVDGSTVFVGTITAEGESVSIDIPISGNNLTKDLTASLMGAGFSFLTRDITIPYADVNAGTAKVTVAYNGTAPEATGRLTLRSDEVTAVVNLTASYRLPVVLTDTPAGYVAQDSAKPDRITTSIIETLFDQTPAEVVSVTYVNSLGMASDKPFDGINIVVTRYSDGTSRTTKVVR